MTDLRQIFLRFALDELDCVPLIIDKTETTTVHAQYGHEKVAKGGFSSTRDSTAKQITTCQTVVFEPESKKARTKVTRALQYRAEPKEASVKSK